MKPNTWLAVSTHPGEYDAIKLAHELVLSALPDTKLMIAPRHPHTCYKVKQIFAHEPSVHFNETLGNMHTYFQQSDIVFVGGTFNRTGGHNILEPISYKLPTIVGPHTDKIDDLIELVGGVIQVADGKELGKKIIELLSDPSESERIANSNHVAYLKAKEGVLESYLNIICPIIDSQLEKRLREIGIYS